MPKCIADTEIGERPSSRSSLPEKPSAVVALNIVATCEVLGALLAAYVYL